MCSCYVLGSICHNSTEFIHNNVIKWKHFPCYWPFVRGIHRSPVNSPHKGQWRGALLFSLIWYNKRLGKQSWCWWFETPLHPLWRHCDDQELKPSWKRGLITMETKTLNIMYHLQMYPFSIMVFWYSSYSIESNLARPVAVCLLRDNFPIHNS